LVSAAAFPMVFRSCLIHPASFGGGRYRNRPLHCRVSGKLVGRSGPRV